MKTDGWSDYRFETFVNTYGWSDNRFETYVNTNSLIFRSQGQRLRLLWAPYYKEIFWSNVDDFCAPINMQV
jgi:hypothetical protein